MKKTDESRKKFTGDKRRAERAMNLMTGGTAELRQVALGSATQSVWLRHRKVISKAVGLN